MLETKKQNIPNFSVKIDDNSLERCASYKYLGVVIDEKLNWGPHIEHIAPKIAKACGALARLRNCTSTDVLKNVFHALIHSYLRYGILIWGNASQTVLDPLRILLNKAVRIMVFAPFGNIDLNPAYDYLKILNVPKIFMLETGKFQYKYEKNLLPTEIGNYFKTSADNVNQHNYGLRSRNNDKAPRFISRSKIGEKSIQFKGNQIWNAMPLDIKKSESLSIFKSAYKKFLLESEIDPNIFLNPTNLLLCS